jgi:hypothetical protein
MKWRKEVEQQEELTPEEATEILENIIPEDNQELTPDEFLEQLYRKYDEASNITGYRDLLEKAIAAELRTVSDLCSADDYEDVFQELCLYIYNAVSQKTFNLKDPARITVRLYKLARVHTRNYTKNIKDKYKTRLKYSYRLGLAAKDDNRKQDGDLKKVKLS